MRTTLSAKSRDVILSTAPDLYMVLNRHVIYDSPITPSLQHFWTALISPLGFATAELFNYLSDLVQGN